MSGASKLFAVTFDVKARVTVNVMREDEDAACEAAEDVLLAENQHIRSGHLSLYGSREVKAAEVAE